MVLDNPGEEQLAYKSLSPYSEEFASKIDKQDFLAGLITYGQRILAGTSVTNTTFTIYDVPEGNTLFLTSAVMTVNNSAATTNDTVNMNIGGQSFFTMWHPDQDGFSDSLSLNFTVPIKVNSGETISLSNGGVSSDAVGRITGYLVPQSLIPNFL